MKDLTETASLQAFRMKYEAGRSFDLEDDMEFCPNLLTDSDVSNAGDSTTPPPSHNANTAGIEALTGLPLHQQLMSIHSAASSERSSLASNSPEASPTQQPTQVAQPFSLNSSSPAFVPPTSFQQTQQNSQQQAAAAAAASQQLKLHQPAATRARNAIPIINPATGITMASPPPSVSPARMQPALRRW